MKKILAVVLCLVLCLSLSVTAFATSSQVGTADSGFTTTLKIDDDVTVPTINFAYSFAPSTKTLGTGEYTVASAISTSFAASDMTDGTGELTKTVSASDVFASSLGVDKPIKNAGLWIFNVTETVTLTEKSGFSAPTSSTASGVITAVSTKSASTGSITETWTDTLKTTVKTYEMHLYVINGTSGLEIQAMSVYASDGTTKLDLDKFVFESTYTEDYEKSDPTGKSGAVSVTKHIDQGRDNANLIYAFPITITLTDAQTGSGGSVAGKRYTASTGTTTDVTLNYGDNTFELADGDYISIPKLPVGASYSVAEGSDFTGTAGKDGYKFNASSSVNLSKTLETGTTGFEAKVVNDYTSATPTGIVVNNLPFVLIVVLALAGMAVFFVSSRRKAEEN